MANQGLWQIPVLWLVLSRSGFFSTYRFHGNGPNRVFLIWSERKTVNIAFFTVKLPEEAKKVETSLGPYCHDLGPIFPSIRSSRSLSKRLVFCPISEEVTRMGSYCFCRCCAPGHFNFMFWVRFQRLWLARKFVSFESYDNTNHESTASKS